MAKELAGIIPILSTPFTKSDDVDFDSIPRLVDFAVGCGAHAFALPAYGSEFYKLTDEERVEIVRWAVEAAGGRIPVVGQANHPGAQVANGLALRMADAGADAIAINLPRIFSVTDEDLARYMAVVCEGVEVPVLVQDFNPGGATVGVEFCLRLHEQCPQFKYIKLEEPALGPKMQAIHDATGREVKVLEGWGGLFMLELMPHGLHGVMPGLAVVDLLVRAWDLMKAGNGKGAFAVFSAALPFIEFSLHSMETFHHIEKSILVDRDALPSAQVREITTHLDPIARGYLDYLRERLWETLDRFDLPRQP